MLRVVGAVLALQCIWFLAIEALVPSLMLRHTRNNDLSRTRLTLGTTAHDSRLSRLSMSEKSNHMNFLSYIDKDIGTVFQKYVSAIWNFSRPHTIIGSALSLVCLYLFATPSSVWFTSTFIKALLNAALPALLTNLYVTGLNQLTDTEIDKVNKPYLPLASGALSYTQGLLIVVLCFMWSLNLVKDASWPLRMTVYGSAILGTLYSMPPFRLKRFPLFAAMSIIVVRGTLVNLGFFLDAKSSVMGVAVGDTIGAVLGTALQFPEAIAATAYFAIFGTIIAIMKDVPDIIGDRLFSIPSFSVQLGAARVFTFAWQLLFSLLSIGSIACFSAFLTPILAGQSLVGRTGTMASRLVAGALLGFLGKDVRKRASVVKAEDSESVFKYYMHLWNVFYACYVIMPFLRT